MYRSGWRRKIWKSENVAIKRKKGKDERNQRRR